MARFGRAAGGYGYYHRGRGPSSAVQYVTFQAVGAGANGITLSDPLILAGDLALCVAFQEAASGRTWQSPLTNDASGQDGTLGWGLGHGLLATPTDTVSVNTGTSRLRANILRGASGALDDYDINSGAGTSATVSGALTLSDPGGMVVSWVFLDADSVTISDPGNMPVSIQAAAGNSAKGNRTPDGGHGIAGSFTPDPFTWTGSHPWVRVTAALKTA